MPHAPLPESSDVSNSIAMDVLSLAHDGRAVCREGGKVVFVRGGLPGQRIQVRLTHEKKRFAEGQCVAVLRPAPDAVPAPCPHAGACGGCPLQEMPYASQLYWKSRILEQTLLRIGKLPSVPLQPIIPSPRPWGYRNKMEWAFANGAEGELLLGMRAAGSHAVVNIRDCLLPPPGGMDVARALRPLAAATGLPAWEADAEQGHGFWRHAVVRMPQSGASNAPSPCLLTCITAPGDARARDAVKALGQELMARLPRLTGFVHEERRAPSMVAQGERTVLRLGETTLQETLGGLSFSLDHGGFFQINTDAAESLCATARRMAALRGTETLWDLYCGAGAPGLCLARDAAEVWGVEVSAPSVDRARRNAAAAGMTHCQYEAGDAATTIHGWSAPHVVLADPPRAGMHADVIHRLLRAQPDKIIYISCNPATLARDIALLSAGYDVAEVVPVDLFPQTPHVESVTLLHRRSGG